MTTPSREEEQHYLKAIRLRLETLYALSINDPRLREQLSDEVDWINVRLAAQPSDDGVSGISIEHRLQAVRQTAIEECLKLSQLFSGPVARQIEQRIRALSKAPKP